MDRDFVGTVMNRDAVGGLVLVAAFLWSMFSVGYIGCSVGKSEVREEAIKAGAAHWTIDPKTGERKFEFIKEKHE